MTSDPDKSQVDIKNLLNLLNASEESSAASEFQPEMIDEPKLDHAQRLTSLKRLANVSNPLSAGDPDATPDHFEDAGGPDNIDHGSPEDDTENRFAAHIVHVMSKLKRK